MSQLLPRARHLHDRLTLRGQLDRLQAQLDTAQRDCIRRRQLLHRAATQVSHLRSQVSYHTHLHRETRTILLISRSWDSFPAQDEVLETRLFDAKRAFNRTGAMGTKIRWFRCDRSEYASYASIPYIPGSSNFGGSIKLWITLVHKWDDRVYGRHTDHQWRSIASSFAYNELQQVANIHGFKVADTS